MRLSGSKSSPKQSATQSLEKALNGRGGDGSPLHFEKMNFSFGAWQMRRFAASTLSRGSAATPSSLGFVYESKGQRVVISGCTGAC